MSDAKDDDFIIRSLYWSIGLTECQENYFETQTAHRVSKQKYIKAEEVEEWFDISLDRKMNKSEFNFQLYCILDQNLKIGSVPVNAIPTNIILGKTEVISEIFKLFNIKGI